MLKKVKIGTWDDQFSMKQSQITQHQLANINMEAELVLFNGNGSQAQEAQLNRSAMENALLRGEVDMAVHPLDSLPTTQPKGLVLAGVSHRDNPANWLHIQPASQEDGQLFSLKGKALVGTFCASDCAQLHDFRPDIQIKIMQGDVVESVEQFRRGDFDAIVLPACHSIQMGLEVSELKVIKFNPREFIPSPGQGVMAYQCCEADLEMRRLVKQLHRPEVAAVTNIERSILKGLGGAGQLPIGAYCEQDANGHYHVWASFAASLEAPVKRVRLSSSTSFNLAERVVEMLLNGK